MALSPGSGEKSLPSQSILRIPSASGYPAAREYLSVTGGCRNISITGAGSKSVCYSLGFAANPNFLMFQDQVNSIKIIFRYEHFHKTISLVNRGLAGTTVHDLLRPGVNLEYLNVMQCKKLKNRQPRWSLPRIKIHDF